MTGFHSQAVGQRQQMPRLLLLFAAAALVFCAIFGWLVWRLIEQDRHLERQRAAERLAAISTGLSDDLMRRLTTIERDLEHISGEPAAESDAFARAFGSRLPSDSLLVIIEREGARVYPSGRALWAPRIAEAKQFVAAFQAAERYEFTSRDFSRAADALRPLTRGGDSQVRAGALLRLARVLKKAGRPRAALSVYDELAALGGVPVAHSSADLMARYGRCLTFDELKERARLNDEAQALLAALAGGNPNVDGTAYRFYVSECRRWLGGGVVELPSNRLALSHAAEALDRQYERGRTGGEVAGKREFPSDRYTFLLLWQSTPERFAGLVAGPRLFEPSRVVLSGEAVDARLVPRRDSKRNELYLARALPDPSVPWRLEVRATPASNGEMLSIRGRLLGLTGLAAGVLFVMTTYFISRAMLRELKVMRLQSDFVAAVSHDFRTPLTSIRQLSEMLADGRVISEERRAHYHDQLRRQSERLQRLVENLLDFKRIESAVPVGHFQRLDPRDLVESVAAEFRIEVSDRGFELNVEARPDLPAIRGDREVLGRAIWNLLDNAVKYSSGQKRVSIHLSSDADHLSIAVRDHGLGIAQHELESIFCRFSRGESARISGARGTGLGLAMVREMAAAHGGSVLVESAPGVGSTFTITLPVERSA
jgi:signal transduction histidine kinase